MRWSSAIATVLLLGALPTSAGLRATAISILYTLSKQASVRLKLSKARAGRKVKGRCVKPTRTNRRKRSCTRYVTVSSGIVGPGAAGANQFPLPVGQHRLPRGRYKATVTAQDAAGARVTATVRFRVT